MSSIADLEARLARYKATEQEILEQGQRIKDEDERDLQRANLSTVQVAIKELQAQLAAVRNPKRGRTRQYAARV
ncbi:hypothetical protein [Vibrio parahaemolyticus]|uniref:hypothetical protein n=1 Tax=Vibrio parahaemolyticus TaxID=670 RepID=UPI001781CA03|nr:hypothetical protein [Vibrio parahaemolyticus]MBD6946484.1 hypothetical protein [Vibrio parahaemolyticus]MBD6960099.1 hypothetical protein [Vibrio parahaemolyticus]MBD6979229.1 hypothetical protein [Vibrio parahaemolyticus]MBD6992304.1 hypothetical protein [Vibrio parahaemolyticus]